MRVCCSSQLLVLSVSLYPGLWAIGVQLHSVFTGSYVPGHHSVLLVNSPNEQAAKDIGRYTAGPRWVRDTAAPPVNAPAGETL